jgi:tRNA A-37 threonylcarbamoyl transferase component Bud32
VGDSVKILNKDNVKFAYVPGHDEFVQNILTIQELFASEKGEILHNARNVIKEISVNNSKLVIKSFRIPGLWGRLLYTYFRSSKAKRSYQYSLKLKAKGISVPAPVAYIECYEKSLLKESFYISEKFSYDCTLHEVLRNEMFSCEDVLPVVARFAFDMHQKDFLHLDFSPGNILVKKVGETYQLSMVDVNRMHIGAVDFELGLNGFTRLLRDEQGVTLLANAYADCAIQDREGAVKKLKLFYLQYTKSSELIRRVKSPFKRTMAKS